MKRLLIWVIVAVVIAVAGAAGYSRIHAARSGGVADNCRTMPVHRGDIKVSVNSTGTVQPVLSVQVGANISGPIDKIFVDFNSKVKANEVIALIDPRTYKSAVCHEQASLAHSRADLARVEALYEQALRTERRVKTLQTHNAISETDVDQSLADRKSLAAQIDLAKATVQECEANLATAKTNLDFTEIKSPVDGIVIDRKVDPGQTVAAQFQTPVMFVIAPDLEKKIHIYASVDEADIGLIRRAQRRNEPVSFSVDAYPDDAFAGDIAQVRLNSSTVSNVVTYTVIVESPNPQMKLLPGMTANLTFQIEKRGKVLAVPNAALRFHPTAEQVRPCDRHLLDEDEAAETEGPADAAAGSPRNVRHVWVTEGGLLSAVEVVVGLGDKRYTEIVSGSLSEGQPLVTDMQGTSSKSGSGLRPPPPPGPPPG